MWGGRFNRRRMGRVSAGVIVVVVVINLVLLAGAHGAQCGSQAGGKRCANNLCCSQYGWCGSTSAYCGDRCQSQCSSGGSGGGGGTGSGVGSIISSSTFNDMFPSKNSFYTYASFISAANAFAQFGSSGSSDDKKRELAAFFANVQQETGGLQYLKEINPSSTYCQSSTQYPCASGKSYYGRGPLQLSWNYNYGAAGSYLKLGLLNNPDLLVQDAGASFKASLWFWTQSPSSAGSCHQAMVGGSGFGKTIRIINGGYECGKGSETSAAANRISYYKKFCSKLGVSPGNNLSCA